MRADQPQPVGVIDGTDYQFSGTVRDVDAAAISRLLRNEARVPQRAPEPRDLMFYA